MSRNFIGVQKKPYIGAFPSLGIDLCKPTNTAPQIVPLFIQWNTYQLASGPDASVILNFAQSGPGGVLLDRIVSVYIDNLGSDVPVFVYFPDTGYTIPAAAGSCNWYPAITNAKECEIIALGMTPGDLSTTRVFVSNVRFDTFSNSELDQAIALWRASPTISRGTTIYNTQYGIPALGDTTFQANLNLVPGGNVTGVMNTPIAGYSFIYITELYLNLISADGVGGPFSDTIFLESTGVSGILYQWPYVAPGAPEFNFNLYQGHGLQIKIAAGETWRLRHTTALGGAIAFATLIINYTISNG